MNRRLEAFWLQGQDGTVYGVQNIFGRVSDEKPGNSGTPNCADDHKVHVEALREIRNDVSGATLYEMDGSVVVRVGIQKAIQLGLMSGLDTSNDLVDIRCVNLPSPQRCLSG